MKYTGRSGLKVLTYHRIGTLHAEFPGFSTQIFEQQLAWMSRFCKVISADEMTDPDVFQRHSRPRVLLTFDDAFRDFYVNAYPLLEKYQLPALVFVPTEAADEGDVIWPERLGAWLRRAEQAGQYPQLLLRVAEVLSGLGAALDSASQTGPSALKSHLKRCTDEQKNIVLREIFNWLAEQGVDPHIERQIMTWDEMRAMQPLVSYGTHTHTHPIVSRLAENGFAKEMQICTGRMQQELGQPPTLFAFPNGQKDDFTDADKAVLKDMGYTHAFANYYGVFQQRIDRLEIPRIPTCTKDVAGLSWLMYRA